jgi:hypothetical protein
VEFGGQAVPQDQPKELIDPLDLARVRLFARRYQEAEKSASKSQAATERAKHKRNAKEWLEKLMVLTDAMADRVMAAFREMQTNQLEEEEPAYKDATFKGKQPPKPLKR